LLLEAVVVVSLASAPALFLELAVVVAVYLWGLDPYRRSHILLPLVLGLRY
jgi:hypothetical protein